MSTTSARAASGSSATRSLRDPAYGAYRLLHVGFVALPLLMGLDKFTNTLTEWPVYLAPWIVELSPFSAQTAMYVVGVIEIVAGLAVAVKPRYAAYVVALWLTGIIVNLLTYPRFHDVALRDFGLLIAALALARLAAVYNRPDRHPDSGTDAVSAR
ncbi:hypothetical protein [Glycomyces tarimensis]